MATVVKVRVVRPRGQSAEAAPPPVEDRPLPKSKSPRFKGTPTLCRDRLDTYCDIRGLNARTRNALEVALKHAERLGLTELTSESLSTYRRLREQEAVSSSTIKGELNKLRSLGRWLGNKIDIVMPQEVARAPKAWNREQLSKLFWQAENTDRTIGGIPGSVYWPALLHLMYDSAERIGALMAVRWSDIDLEARTLTAAAEVRKGRRYDLTHRLSDTTIAALVKLGKRTDAKADDLVFPKVASSTLWKSYDNLLRDAGLPAGRRDKFHRVRRTSATECYIAGGDASAMLGHHSPSMTRERYIDVTAYKPVQLWRPGESKKGILGRIFGK